MTEVRSNLPAQILAQLHRKEYSRTITMRPLGERINEAHAQNGSEKRGGALRAYHHVGGVLEGGVLLGGRKKRAHHGGVLMGGLRKHHSLLSSVRSNPLYQQMMGGKHVHKPLCVPRCRRKLGVVHHRKPKMEQAHAVGMGYSGGVHAHKPLCVPRCRRKLGVVHHRKPKMEHVGMGYSGGMDMEERMRHAVARDRMPSLELRLHPRMGAGRKATRRPSAWNHHVSKVRLAHPHLPFRDAVKLASSTYRK